MSDTIYTAYHKRMAQASTGTNSTLPHATQTKQSNKNEATHTTPTDTRNGE